MFMTIPSLSSLYWKIKLEDTLKLLPSKSLNEETKKTNFEVIRI